MRTASGACSAMVRTIVSAIVKAARNHAVSSAGRSGLTDLT
jgi:hypothetical protein